MYRFRDKAQLRAALAKAGVVSKADLARRLEALMGKEAGPSRQYLSRILADDGDETTSQATAEGICYVARIANVEDMFVVPVDATVGGSA